MTHHLIPIGNSLGLRIPKPIIAQVGFKEDTDLAFKVTEEGLLITPVRATREGWKEAFKSPKKHKKTLLIGDEVINKFDRDEWEW